MVIMDNVIVCLFNGIMAKWSFDNNMAFWGWVNLVFSALNMAHVFVQLTA